MDGFARLLRRRSRNRLPPREAYELWADAYPPWPHNPLMRAEQAMVAPIILSTTPARALDVGTGTGRYLPILISAGARTVVGIDMSLAMLRRKAYGVPRVCGDACRLPFPDGTFNLVCSSLMAGDLDIEDLGAWVAEAVRVLAPGGHLIYSDFHPSWAAERWRRTFRTAGGRLVEVAYFPHSIEEHLALLDQAKVTVRTVHEPRLTGRRPPVVVVIHAVKGGPNGRSNDARARPAAAIPTG